MASVEVDSDQVTVHIEGMDRSWRAPSQVFASGFGGRHGFHFGRGVPSDVTCAGGRHDFCGQKVRRAGRDRPLRRDHNFVPIRRTDMWPLDSIRSRRPCGPIVVGT
jgi:hypothetical protein